MALGDMSYSVIEVEGIGLEFAALVPQFVVVFANSSA
jgi:hypothetical protein